MLPFSANSFFPVYPRCAAFARGAYQNELYEYHLKTNPKEAEAYAIRTNDRHNQKKKEATTEKISASVSQNGGIAAAAWTLARGLNQISGIDDYNKQLERAAIGQNRVSNTLSFSEIRDTIDDTNEKNLSQKYGELAGDSYRMVTNLTDALITKKAYGKEFFKVPFDKKKELAVGLDDILSAADTFSDEYMNNQDQGVSGIQLGLASGLSALGDFSGSMLSEGIKLDSKGEIPSLTRRFLGESAGEALGQVAVGSTEWFARERSRIDTLTKQVMEKEGIPEKQAKHKVLKRLFNESAANVIAGTMLRK